MFRLICLVIGYAIGCFQTAFIVGKAVGKIDIRDYGSGNAGMTNITRVMGPKAGLIVFLSDIFKAVVGYYICTFIFKGTGVFVPGDGNLLWLPGLYGGIGVILGHNFPFYMKFKGGKGIAATVGVIMCLDFRIAAIIYVIAIALIIVSKYISLASLVMTLLLPILMYALSFDTESIVLGCVIAVLAYYQHRANIVRLINGTENKFSLKKKV